jgi:hypothetical protein
VREQRRERGGADAGRGAAEEVSALEQQRAFVSGVHGSFVSRAVPDIFVRVVSGTARPTY